MSMGNNLDGFFISIFHCSQKKQYSIYTLIMLRWLKDEKSSVKNIFSIKKQTLAVEQIK